MGLDSRFWERRSGVHGTVLAAPLKHMAARLVGLEVEDAAKGMAQYKSNKQKTRNRSKGGKA